MNRKYRLNERVSLFITRKDEADFDRACESAYKQAIQAHFEVDDCGHIINVEGADRSEHAVYVDFKSYQVQGSMAGIVHWYVFEAWVG